VRHRFRNFSKADCRYLLIYANDVLFVLGAPDWIVEVVGLFQNSEKRVYANKFNKRRRKADILLVPKNA
jgi:hypothetical protein